MFRAYAAERFGEDSLQPGVYSFPPGEASAYIVFPEPGLGFVDTQGSKCPKREAVVFERQPLFVEGVAGLVDTTPGHVGKVVLVDAGGDADVMSVEAGSKGGFGDVLPAGFEIEPE